MEPKPMPQVRLPSPEIFKTMGQDNIVRLVEAVYDELSRSPIAHMFAVNHDELMASAQKSALFWVTACGGPPLYEKAFGPPRMRARHMDFGITQSDRDTWVACWMRVLDTQASKFMFPEQHMESFKNYICDFSLWMVSQ